ncbi:MAG: hypothetical protein ACHP8B_01730 [Terriglobales bacterium]
MQELPVEVVDSYSPLEHLARSVRLDGKWRESIFVMFTPYFDCSHGSDGKGAWVVSGWLSTVGQWEAFTVDWKLVLAKFGVTYFHMKEFAHSTDEYANGWKGEDTKRALFIRSLLSVIDSYAKASFSCLIERSVFDEMDKEYEVREYFGNEYAICARTCVAEVNKWLLSHGYETPAEYVFEDGDERGRLSYLIESTGYPAPIFKPSRDRITKDGVIIRGLLPLQAADFAAYEIYKGWHDFGDVEEIWKYRKSFVGLGKAANGEGYWGRLTADDVRLICESLGVSKHRQI